MRYFTKEWYELLETVGNVEMFMPVESKNYSDEEFEVLYQETLNTYLTEEERLYNSAPELFIDVDPEDFDPEDYLMVDIDEEGEETNARNPETYEEFMEFQKREFEALVKEFENRPPFDRDNAAQEFEEMYQSNLECGYEFLPDDLVGDVDPRLLALGLLPEDLYEILSEREKANQEMFDRINEAADEAAEDLYVDLPDEFINLPEDLDSLDASSVVGETWNGDALEIVIAGWDEEGEDIKRTILFEDCEIVEDEGLEIAVAADDNEDELVSNCDLLCHELYYEDDKFEVHMMFENEGLKYLTLQCSGVYVIQESC